MDEEINNYEFLELECIEEYTSEEEYVYDIVMHDSCTPNFFANNVLVHNSSYFKTYASDPDEALLVAKAVTNKINASFPQLARDLFFCTPGYDNLIKVEQEIIAKKAIFTNAKKSYMLHVVKKDGKDVDFVKVIGLQIKKTSTPKPVRVKLAEYLEEFIRGADWEPIGMKYLELREMLKESNKLELIGLPKNVKNVEDYQKRFDSKEIGLSLPGHVSATMLWNYCLKTYADKESMTIVSGMKIRTLYLTKPIGRYKSIAIPAEQKYMPLWFKDNFIRLIDKEAQALRLVNGPMKSILKAIEKEIPTRKTLLIDELFG